jgi:hypothetical protein
LNDRQRFSDTRGMDDAPGHRAWTLNRDFNALQTVQVVDGRTQRLGAERHVAEARVRVVTPWQLDGTDAAGGVEYHQRRQHVVHLIERHIEAEFGRAVHVSLVLKVADARRGQHHPLEGEFRRNGRGSAE